MIRAGLGVDGPIYHPQTAVLSSSRSTSLWDGERGCSQRETTPHLKGFLVLKGDGSQLTGAEKLTQGESFPPLPKAEALKQFFMKGKLNPTSQSQEKKNLSKSRRCYWVTCRQTEGAFAQQPGILHLLCCSSNAKSTAIHLFLITVTQAANLTSRLGACLLPPVYLS